MSAPSPQLESWMNEMVGTLLSNTDHPQLDRFEVLFAGDDHIERLRVLRVEDTPGELDASELPALFARGVHAVCEQHAQTLPSGTPLRYAVQAYRAPADTTPEASFYLVLQGALLLAQPAGSSPAAAQGQLIRHNENLHALAMNLMNAVAGRLTQDLEQERLARQAAERRTQEVFALREQLLDRQHERNLEAAREERDAQTKQQLLELVKALAPVVLSRLAPRAPNAPEPELSHPAVLRDQAVRRIIAGLSADELQKIIVSVKPGTQAALLELIDTYEKSPAAGPPAAKTPEN
jgi:hypothetical protein